MAELFAERMEICRNIGEYKAANGLQITDSKREEELKQQNCALVPEELRPYYLRFLCEVITESKKYQENIIHTDDLFVSLGEQSYPISVGRGNLSEAGEFLSLYRRVLILTDDGVPSEYSRSLAKLCREPVILTLPQGEKSKNLDSFVTVLSHLHENGFERSDCLVAVGGGVVGDIGGFAASAYMRGIDFFNVPTTLLSMVDSSVGGKTAVDFGKAKNSVGSFYQPKGVLIDTALLDTLDSRQFSCGMAEIIKMFAICDKESFEKLENNGFEDISEIIRAALKIKINIVEKDEKESDLRRVLNFGHTVGHAVEVSYEESDRPLLHGECVGIGMLAMSRGNARERIENLLLRYSLPTSCSCRNGLFLDSVSLDKKSSGGRITAVTCGEIGKYEFVSLTPDEIAENCKEAVLLYE